MQSRTNSKIIYFPIKILLGFLIFSEILYFIGPIDYQVESNIILFFYLALLNCCLYVGFCKGAKKNIKRKHRQRDFSIRAVHIIIVLALVVYFLKYVLQLQIYSLSVFVQKIVFALQNSGDVYKNKLESSTPTGMTYVFMLLSPITLLGQTLGLYYWKKLSKVYRCFVFAIFILEISIWLFSGTRKGVFDAFIIIIMMLLLLEPKIILNKKKFRKFSLLMALGVMMFIGYFIISNLSRHGIDASEFGDYDIGSIRPFYSENFSVSFNIILSNITGYLCQGYKALSLALNDFFDEGVICFTWGLGSSWFNINMAENLLHFNPLPDTYMGYLATHYGIDEMVNWHTLYLWLANDFTFIGTPFVIYGLGYLFSCTWVDALYHRNRYATPMSALCALIIVYSFANNQVISFNFISFFVIITLYLNNRRQ